MTTTKNKKMVNKDPVVRDEYVAKQAAMLMITGLPAAEVAKQCGITVQVLKEIADSEAYKKHVEEAADREFNFYLRAAKMRLSRLTEKAVKTVDEAMSEGGWREKLEAAKIVLRAAGLEQAKEAGNDSSVTIVLPNGVTTTQDKPEQISINLGGSDELQDK